MTLVKLSPLVTAASGSMDGITFVSGKPGDYVRERIKPLNPNTEKQQAVRAIQTQLSQHWSSNMSDMQRQSWDNEALKKAEKNRVGTEIELTPQAIFTRYNFARLYPALLNGDTLAPLDVPVLPLQLYPLKKVAIEAFDDSGCVITPTPAPNVAKLAHYVIIKSSLTMRSGAISPAQMTYRKVVTFLAWGGASYNWDYPIDIGTIAVGARITIGLSYVNANTGAETATISQIITKS